MKSRKFPLIFVCIYLIVAEGKFAMVSSERAEDRDPQMILIPAGEFSMGYDSEPFDAKPVHKVFLDSYYIDKYELTNSQYHEFWKADGGEKSSHTPLSFGEEGEDIESGDWPKVAKTKPNYPVVGVSWFDAQAYAKWAKKRLPTEAEWEKAARKTDARLWPWGDDFYLKIGQTTIHANVGNAADGYENSLSPVGSYPTGASLYGVMDMAGNVWEWVADWYSRTYYYHSPKKNPPGPKTGSWRVVRGGSWANDAYSASTVNRFSAYPDMGTSFIGIRLVKDLPKNP